MNPLILLGFALYLGLEWLVARFLASFIGWGGVGLVMMILFIVGVAVCRRAGFSRLRGPIAPSRQIRSHSVSTTSPARRAALHRPASTHESTASAKRFSRVVQPVFLNSIAVLGPRRQLPSRSTVPRLCYIPASPLSSSCRTGHTYPVVARVPEARREMQGQQIPCHGACPVSGRF